ncbi:unnamed protein product [Ilex paraguariensis]|uniref:pectinesterase n=1 Tax=Ilex paraguariensis TaxID=185542 RepID=A0ABC8TUE2_9AQUA
MSSPRKIMGKSIRSLGTAREHGLHVDSLNSDRTELFLSAILNLSPQPELPKTSCQITIGLTIEASRVIGTGTLGCGSAIVEEEDFIAKNTTFENSTPEGSGQVVAITVTADRSTFYNCRFLGWQVYSLLLVNGRKYDIPLSLDVV